MSEELYFATIGTVYEDGVSLIFDGTEEESQKHYKVNTSVVFKAGDRVKILPCSGTYVVEYVVGNPGSGGNGESSNTPSGLLPKGGTVGQVLKKSAAMDYYANWAPVREVPNGGLAGQVLTKNSDVAFDMAWKSLTVSGVSDALKPAILIYFRYASGKFQISYGGSTWWNLETSL